VSPRTGLGDVERRKSLPLPGLELRPGGRPARSQSLYRLRYPGSHNDVKWLDVYDPEDGDSMFLLNVGKYVSRPRS
jgi:hypothetical protein